MKAIKLPLTPIVSDTDSCFIHCSEIKLGSDLVSMNRKLIFSPRQLFIFTEKLTTMYGIKSLVKPDTSERSQEYT